MPIVRKGQGLPNAPTESQQAATEEPQGSGWGSWAGTGVRLGGGFLSNAGGLPGALIGGGSELLAELLEGSLFKQPLATTAARVGTEAGIGAIPLGKTLSAGRALASAGKGAAFNTAGDIGRQVSEQYDPMSGRGVTDTDIDWGRTGLAGILGGGVNAALGHFAPRFEGPTGPPKPEVVANDGTRLHRANSAHTGTGPRSAGPVYNESGLPHGPQPQRPSIASQRMPIRQAVDDVPVNADMAGVSQPGGLGEPSLRSKAHAPVAADPRAASATRDLANMMDQAFQEDRIRSMRSAMGLGGGLQDSLTNTEQTLAREAKNAAALQDLTNLKNTLGLELEPDASITRTVSAETPTGRETANLRYSNPAEEAAEAASGGGRRNPRRISNGTEVDPNIELIIQKGMSSPEGSQNRLFAEWLIAGEDIDSAMANAAKGVRPVPPGRVAQITGTIEGEVVPTARLAGMQDDGAGGQFPLYHISGGPSNNSTVSAQKLAELGIKNPDDVASPLDDELTKLLEGGLPPLPKGQVGDPEVLIDDPLVKLLHEDPIGDNPAGTYPAVPRLPTFDETTGITDDIPGATGMNWVDEQLDDIQWRGGEDTPSRFGGRGPAKPRAPKPKLPPIADATEQQGLQDLLNFLDVDAAYGRASEAGRKALGGIYGRTKSLAERSNAPSGVAPKLSSESGASQTELLIQSALGIGGAMAGAALDEEGSNIEGALGGFAAGMGAGFIPKLLQSVNLSPEVLQSEGGIREAARKIVDHLPGYQRAAYLYDLRGLPANILAAPYGSMMTGAVEAILKGDDRGWAALKLGYNPIEFLRRMKEAGPEAVDRLRKGELGRAEGIDLDFDKLIPDDISTGFRTGMAAPGLGMTIGDVTARRILMEAGFSMDEARLMTLTSEPEGPIAKSIVNFGKSSPLANILLPFRRTPANIMEQGAPRTPGLGLARKFFSKEDMSQPQNWRELGVEQGLGLGAGTVGYQVGQELDDPRNSAQNMASRTVTNASGRYSMPTMLGMMLGRTMGQDKNITIRDVQRGAEQSIPLPALSQIVDSSYYGLSKMGLTGTEDPRAPRGLVPFQHLLQNDEAPMLSNLSRLRRMP